MILAAAAQSTDIPVGVLFAAIGVLTTILATAFAIIGYFLKDIRAGMKDKQQEQDKRIEAIEKSHNDLKAALPEKFVLREDFTRWVVSLDTKISDLFKEVRDIAKSINGGAK